MAKRKHRRIRHGQIMSEHHIVPRSRGGRKDNGNVVLVCEHCHAHYHALFGNMKPNQIIEHLVKHFWNGQNFWIERYLNREDSS